MTTPLGMLDYFAMEASEYIDRLRGLTELYNRVDDGAYADVSTLHRKLARYGVEA